MDAQAILVGTKMLKSKINQSPQSIKKHHREEAEAGRDLTTHPWPLAPHDLQRAADSSSLWSL